MNEPEPADYLTRGMQIRAVRAETRTADFICSSDSLDSYGEIVEQSFRLERYLKNPIVLYAHNSLELPIGHANNVGVVDGMLQCTIHFASEKANPQAERVWQSLQEGTLRSVSIGFYPNSVRLEKRDGNDVYVLSDNELYEVSVVPIPANPDAVMKMRAKAFASANAPPAKRAAEGGEKKEKRMDSEKEDTSSLKTALVEARSAAEVVKRELDTERVRVAALEKQNALLVQERDAALKNVSQLEEKAIEDEVGAFFGKKELSKDELPDLIRLRKFDKALFERQMAQRRDLNLLEARVIRSSPATDAPADPGSDDLASAIDERVRSRRVGA